MEDLDEGIVEVRIPRIAWCNFWLVPLVVGALVPGSLFLLGLGYSIATMELNKTSRTTIKKAMLVVLVFAITGVASILRYRNTLITLLVIGIVVNVVNGWVRPWILRAGERMFLFFEHGMI